MRDTKGRGIPRSLYDVESSKPVDIMTMVNDKMSGLSTVRLEMNGAILCLGGD